MRSRGRHAMMALAALVVLIGTAGAAHAQVLVVSERNLDFGMLTPGTPAAVAPSDVIRSAQLRIEGRGNYQVSFQLPASLTSVAGHQIPVLFGSADGLLVIRHKELAFDPASVLTFRINPAEREAVINLGGLAQPSSGQPAGSYTATIVMMVVQTGT